MPFGPRRGDGGDARICRVGLFRVFYCGALALLELEAIEGRDQATGRRPVGIACVRAPLGLLRAAALGLLPLTLLLLLPCFSVSPLDPVVTFNQATSEQLCRTNN